MDEGAHIGAMTPILRTAGHFRLRLAVSQWNRAGQGGQRQGSSFRSTFHVPRLEISALRKQRYSTLVSNWQLLGRPSASVFLARLSVLRPPAVGIRTRPYEYNIKDRLREQGVIYNRGPRSPIRAPKRLRPRGPVSESCRCIAKRQATWHATSPVPALLQLGPVGHPRHSA